MLQSKKNIPNITTDERQALRNPKRNTEVVIREADKESAVVVMSRERYIAKANRQFSETDVYQQVSSNVFFDDILRVLPVAVTGSPNLLCCILRYFTDFAFCCCVISTIT